MSSTDTTAAALLISQDLFFSSKITSTANELGFHVVVEGNVELPPLSVPPTRSVFRESSAREDCGQNSELRTPRFECFLRKIQKGGGIYCDKLTCVTAIRPEKQTFTSAPC